MWYGMKSLFLTVDSGGSKTKFTLWDYTKHVVAKKTTEGFGTATDVEDIHPAFLKALRDFCNGGEIAVVVCNLGGKNKNQMERTIRLVLPSAKVSVFRESEGTIGLSLCKHLQAQVALLAGTGSIAVAPSRLQAVICGGWGANIGDQGSGYELGRAAILTSLEQVDGREPLSDLARLITGISEPPLTLSAQEYCALRDQVRARIAPFDRAHIAQYSKLVCRCAELGDSHAQDLLRKTGEDLAYLVLKAIDKTGEPLKRVVVTGGLVHARQFWQNSFEKRLQEKHMLEQVLYIEDGIDEAMFALAKALNEEE